MATLTLLLALLGSQQPPPGPPPCSAPEYRQFDFWIGEWEVRGPKGELAGHNRIEKIEGGCGLQENWSSAGPNASTGRSINAYNAGDKKWHQIWLGSGGLLMHLSGTFEGDTLTLEGTAPTPSGKVLQHRLQFTKRPDGTVRQFWQTSRDGNTWQVAFEGLYTRRKN